MVIQHVARFSCDIMNGKMNLNVPLHHLHMNLVFYGVRKTVSVGIARFYSFFQCKAGKFDLLLADRLSMQLVFSSGF